MAAQVKVTSKYARCFQALYYGRENDRVHIVVYYCNFVVTFLQKVEK